MRRKKDSKKLVSVKDSGLETCLTLASAHALVLLDDGVVGDPMEKTTLDALEWKLSTGMITSTRVVVSESGWLTVVCTRVHRR